MAYAGALITAFYAGIDALDAVAVTAQLTPDARWHVLAADGSPATTMVGRETIGVWIEDTFQALESVTQQVTGVLDEGTAAAVFTTGVTVAAGESTASSRLDTFRFEDGRICDYVSLLVG